MKKKLEAELISIAHRILKLRSSAELVQLQRDAQLLYEKLSVMVFVDEHFSGVKPTIGRAEAETAIEDAFEDRPQPEKLQAAEKPQTPDENQPDDKPAEKQENEDEKIQEPEKPVEEKVSGSGTTPEMATPTEKEVDEVIAEAEEAISSDKEPQENAGQPTEDQVSDAGEAETETDIPAEENTEEPVKKDAGSFKPAFEWAFEPKTENAPEQSIPDQKTAEPTASGQIAFEDLLGAGYVDPVFVKPDEPGKAREGSSATTGNRPDVIPISRRDDNVPVFKMGENPVSLNDRLSKGSITVGLNDRIAFVKNLFNNSNEEYNRVLSQLLTFDTYGEAEDFINNMVKPDYNNWEGKDEYAQRFMEVVEKKFS